jgi:hypothetical protein
LKYAKYAGTGEILINDVTALLFNKPWLIWKTPSQPHWSQDHVLYLTDIVAKPLANSSVQHGEAANWVPPPRLSNSGTGVEEGVAYGLHERCLFSDAVHVSQYPRN